MTRYRYDRDLDSLVDVGARNFYDPPADKRGDFPTPMVVSDIQPYWTAAADCAADGGRAFIGSRSEHRDFLSRNELVEVGNDYDKRQVIEGKPRRETKAQWLARREQRIDGIKRAAHLVADTMTFRQRRKRLTQPLTPEQRRELGKRIDGA